MCANIFDVVEVIGTQMVGGFLTDLLSANSHVREVK